MFTCGPTMSQRIRLQASRTLFGVTTGSAVRVMLLPKVPSRVVTRIPNTGGTLPVRTKATAWYSCQPYSLPNSSASPCRRSRTPPRPTGTHCTHSPWAGGVVERVDVHPCSDTRSDKRRTQTAARQDVVELLNVFFAQSRPHRDMNIYSWQIQR